MPQHVSNFKAGPFEIRAAGEENAAEVLIYGDIGESWDGQSVDAASFVENLQQVDADYLTVRINSFGGSVKDGLAIYNAIKRHPAATTIEIDGMAVSIASLIAMAGDTVSMADNAMMMIHAPWTIAMGNSTDMREMADMLDKHADAMATSYASKSGMNVDDILALLKDGKDHWYLASEALEAGLIDQISGSVDLDIAASLKKTRFTLPAALAAANTPTKEKTMTAMKPEAAAPESVDNITEIEARAKEKALADEQKRRSGIRNIAQPFAHHEGMQEVVDEMLDDPSVDLPAAQKKILAKLAEGSEPLNTGSPIIHSGMDEKDKYRAGVSAVLAHRMGSGKDDRSNEFRGMSLHQLAAKSLDLTGISTAGLTKSEIASKVLAAHSTSDFPLLLADAANKRLQAAYEAFPSTWNTWAATGEVSDFKTVNLIRMGSFNSLDTIPEGAEYKQGTTAEEREQLTPATKGKYIQLTRQMIINDDLSGFSRLAAMLGRAAARTVNADVYGVINTNGNMSDSTAMFHADHGNLASSGGAVSVATLSAGRSAMRKQTAPGSNATEYLNIMPRYLLVPVVKEDNARAVVTSTDDTDTAGSRKRNIIRDWGPLEVVSDPTLDGNSTTAWYMVADPMEAPLVEVHFLDGQQNPYIDTEEEFLTDAIRWKVRLDYGVAANDYRGGYKNAGS